MKAKFLMLDHGGVLDGEISNVSGQNDLVLQTFDWGDYQVLKNGIKIVENLNVLTSFYGYKIVFHSKNSESDQLNLLSQLKTASAEKKIIFPEVYAMAAYSKNHKDTPSTAPIVSTNNKGIKVATYGQDLDGKACVRQALSVLLDIKNEARGNHIVCDDGPSIFTAAQAEGFQAYIIGGDKDDISLNDAIQKIVNNELLQAVTSATKTLSINSDPYGDKEKSNSAQHSSSTTTSSFQNSITNKK